MAIITADPKILGGTPIFQGTRVPVSNLFDYLLAGDNIKDFLEDFPTVSFSQVKSNIHCKMQNYFLKGMPLRE